MYAPAARKIQGGEVRWGNTLNIDREREIKRVENEEEEERAFYSTHLPLMHAHTHSLQWGEEEEERCYIHRTHCALFEKVEEVQREKAAREPDSSGQLWLTHFEQHLWCRSPADEDPVSSQHFLGEIMTSVFAPFSGRERRSGVKSNFTFSRDYRQTRLMSASLERSDYSTSCMSAYLQIQICISAFVFRMTSAVCVRRCVRATHQAAGSYSAHILTYSSRWCGPRMDESLVRYSKLSMMTATNRFSIWNKNEVNKLIARVFLDKNHWGNKKITNGVNRWFLAGCPAFKKHV